LGKEGRLAKKDEFKLLWVVDFPLFEYSEEDNRWVARHHPFTAPKPDHIAIMIDNDPLISDATRSGTSLCEYKGKCLRHGVEREMRLAAVRSGYSSVNCRKKCLMH
jgi:hypothetical protein